MRAASPTLLMTTGATASVTPPASRLLSVFAASMNEPPVPLPLPAAPDDDEPPAVVPVPVPVPPPCWPVPDEPTPDVPAPDDEDDDPLAFVAPGWPLLVPELPCEAGVDEHPLPAAPSQACNEKLAPRKRPLRMCLIVIMGTSYSKCLPIRSARDAEPMRLVNRRKIT